MAVIRVDYSKINDVVLNYLLGNDIEAIELTINTDPYAHDPLIDIDGSEKRALALAVPYIGTDKVNLSVTVYDSDLITTLYDNNTLFLELNGTVSV